MAACMPAETTHQHRGGRNSSFAAAHVSLNQPVHGESPAISEIASEMARLWALVRGEGKQLFEFRREPVWQRMQVFSFRPLLDTHQPQLKHQKLLKDQPVAGPRQAPLRFWKMDVFQGKTQVAQCRYWLRRASGDRVAQGLRKQEQGVLHGRGR